MKLVSERKLFDLLNSSQAYQAEYAMKMSNHLPMTLIALFFLGSEPSGLQDFYDKYVGNLEPIVNISGNVINHNTWRIYLGKNQNYFNYKMFFANEVVKLDLRGTLECYLPELGFGIGTNAFHALIRLSYGIILWEYINVNKPQDVDHLFERIAQDEIVSGLAYWADSFLHLPKTAGNVSIENLIPAMIIGNKSITSYPSGEWITDRMQLATKFELYQQLATDVLVDNNTLPCIARCVLSLYKQYSNITTLHLITSFHALRVILPFVEKDSELISNYWKALLSACITVNMNNTNNFNKKPLNLNWAEIKSMVLTNNDEHIIKLIFSIRQEFKHYGFTEYHDLANMVVS